MCVRLAQFHHSTKPFREGRETLAEARPHGLGYG